MKGFKKALKSIDFWSKNTPLYIILGILLKIQKQSLLPIH